MAGNRFPHILLLDWPEYNTFTRTKSSRDNKRIPERERQSHSAFVKQQLETAWREAEHEQVVYHVNRKGIYIEFRGEEGFDLITKSLESRMSRDQDSWIKLMARTLRAAPSGRRISSAFCPALRAFHQADSGDNPLDKQACHRDCA